MEKDVNRKRDIIKKVIAYMTLGIDVSRLFTEMIMAIETKDIVVKKMVYHYLSNYAHQVKLATPLNYFDVVASFHQCSLSIHVYLHPHICLLFVEPRVGNHEHQYSSS